MKKFFTLVFALSLLSLILLAPQGVRRGVENGLSLCAMSVLPSLFPFLVLSNFILKSGVLPPSPFLMGAVGGYPLGAQIICNLYSEKRIKKEVAEGALSYCSLCSPGFILGALGGIFGFKKALFIWIFHIATALLFRRKAPKIAAVKAPFLPFSAAIVSSVKEGFFALLNICAFVIFFTVISEVLGTFCSLPVFFRGFLEMSGGVFSLRDNPLDLPLAAAFVSFGGVCVHFQVASLCYEAGLSTKKHLWAKVVQGVLSFIFALFLTFINI